MAGPLPYEPLAESGEPTEAQQRAHAAIATRVRKGSTAQELLADGRLRVLDLDYAELVRAIYVIDPDGNVEQEV